MGQHAALYNLAAWRGPNGRRARQLRDEPLCRMCAASGIVEAATTADHVAPHRGDREAFLHGELQSLCASCHSSLKQREEALGFSVAVGLDGWPLDQRHPANRTPGGGSNL